MGFFGSLLGFDQCMGACNAVLASHLIESAGRDERIRIANEVVRIYSSVYPIQIEVILEELSKQRRVVQMNFIALACDNLYMPPAVPNNVWTRLENPFKVGTQVDNARIEAAIQAIEKQDGVRVFWPGNTSQINFRKMYTEGMLH